MHSQTVGAHPRNPPTRGPSHVLTHLTGDVAEARVGGGWVLWAAVVLVLAVVTAAAVVVPVLQVVVLATVGCDGGSSCDGGKVWWW